jgi:hypothetical protein
MTVATGVDGEPCLDCTRRGRDSNDPTVAIDHHSLNGGPVDHRRTSSSGAVEKDFVEARANRLEAEPLTVFVGAETLIRQPPRIFDPMPGMPRKTRRADVVPDTERIEKRLHPRVKAFAGPMPWEPGPIHNDHR